jgi:thymidine kinase
MANLEYRYGPMNSGKSMAILQMAYNYEENNKKVILVKSVIDSKGGDESYDNFVNTTNYQDIHISTTPVLIIVNNGKVTKFISSKTTYYPKTEIETYITNLMK